MSLVSPGADPKTKEDFDNMKEEFERYKLRAQSVLKNKHTKVCLIQNFILICFIRLVVV
jgi:hypothetical protein